MGKPSELKQKVAQNLRDAFAKEGIVINIFPGDFRTADGFWRRVDVYRWQIYVDMFTNDRWQRVEVSSWDNLTDCAKKGLTVYQSRLNEFMYVWEADAPNRKGSNLPTNGN